jgi:hypothetical protein
MPPHSGPKIRSAGRRLFQNFRNFGPSAREFRPVDELASPDDITCTNTQQPFTPCGRLATLLDTSNTWGTYSDHGIITINLQRICPPWAKQFVKAQSLGGAGPVHV